MVNVLFIDRNDPHTIQWIRGFSEYVDPLEIKVYCISDREPSFESASLQILNIHDIPQRLSLEELQDKFDFSIFKALVVERSFVDYTSFRKHQQYSDLSLDDIGAIILPYLNAYDYVIREKVDLIIDSLADNFLTCIAEKVANFYKVKMIEKFLYYWWSDGFVPVDRPNQTSSILDDNYRHFYEFPEKIDHNAIADTFQRQATSWQNDPPGFLESLIRRFRIVSNRNNSYEPISFRHWLFRRFAWAWSRLLYRMLIRKHGTTVKGERFVYFPLHVCPEAVLLGSTPEMADQFSLIKNISMNLPWGVKLYVKDHPAQQVGLSLNFDFYNRLQNLHNVRYFPPTISSETLFEAPGCLAVAVINGTVGLEAAMKAHKPVYVFGNAIYKEADCFIKPTDMQHFAKHLLAVSKGRFEFNHRAIEAMLMAFIATVVRGEVDFAQLRTWEGRSFASYPLHNDFIKSGLWQNDKGKNDDHKV
jgi:hypothetical protein